MRNAPGARAGIVRGAIAVAVALAAMAVAACGGAPNEGPAPGIASARAVRDVVDGAAKQTTTVEVKFDRDFTLARRNVPLASLFELTVETLSGGAKRVLVDRAEVAADAPRTIRLAVKIPVPDGSELRVARKAFIHDSEGDITAKVQGELTPALAALAAAPLALTDPSLLNPGKALTVKPADRDPEVQRAGLEEHLRRRGADDSTVQRALARYDGMSAAQVPAAKARAALAALTGTFAEPAIDNLLTADNCTGKPARSVVFQIPPQAPSLLARVTFTRDGNRVVSLTPELEAERIERLMPVLTHEAIHCDQTSGRYEEVAATALDTFLYIQLVTSFPDLVKDATRVSRDQNLDAVAMINSGRRYPELIGVLQSDGVTQALPNTNSPHASFAALVAAAYSTIDYNDSPDEPLAQAYVAALAKAAGMPPGSAFNLRYLDELLGRALPPRTYVAAIAALGLR